jgi:hypothetical protein
MGGDQIGEIAEHFAAAVMLGNLARRQQSDLGVRDKQSYAIEQVANQIHLMAANGRLEY